MLDVDMTFVPGAAGLGSFWNPVMERLPSAWRKHTLDLPGLGPVPSRPEVQSYVQLADFVAQGMRAPSVLVGQSMGGYVALELTLRHPERVSQLVLSVAAGGVDMARHGAHDWRVEAQRELPARPPWVLAPTPDLAQRLTEIQVPVLLLWANRDPISPLGVADELLARLPRARLVTFDSDDHWVVRTRASEAAAAIESWLREVGSAG